MRNPARTVQCIRLILADDHPMMLESLACALQHKQGIELLAVAHDGEEVLRLATELLPDIVVMDLNMPRMNGIDATRRLSAFNLGIKVLILSAHADKTFVRHVLNAGAMGYVVKSGIADELILAIRTVASNETYVSPQIASLPLEPPCFTPGPHLLNVREQEVLNLLAQGKKSAEIACQLFLGVGAVEADRLNIMRKLDLHEDALLIRYAITNGLVVR